MDIDYITIQQFAERRSWPPIGGLRHLIRNSHKNGLDESGVIVRVGTRILIDDKGFMAWVGERNDKRKNRDSKGLK